MAVALLLGGLALTGACQDSPGPETPSLNGVWTGSAPDGYGGSFVITATIVDNNGVVSGSGNVSLYGESCAHTVNGTRTGMNFSVNISCGYDPVNYAGAIAAGGKSLSGALNGAGLSNFAFSMSKN
jgi:hypothetical protein